MEILKRTKCAGKVHYASSRYVLGMQNSSAQCGRGEQHAALVWRSDYTRVRLKPISVLTPDGCVDTGCEKGRTWINDVCR